MRKLFAAVICCFLLFLAPCSAQVPVTGAGAGAHTSGGGAYTGPLDVIGSAHFWFGLQCPTSAYTGNLADIWDAATGSTTETLLTCSSGGVVNQTVHLLSVTCAVSCNIKTLYDLSGGTNCTGNPCDLVQATNGSRPLLNQSAIAGKLLVNCTGSSSMSSANNFSESLAQPFTMSSWVEQTSVGSYGAILGTNTGDNLGGIFFTNTADQILMFVTSDLSAFASAADNSFHAAQFLFNNASSEYYIDGSATAKNIASTDVFFSGAPVAMCDTGGQPMTGFIGEAGAWAGDQSAHFSAMNTNQHARW